MKGLADGDQCSRAGALCVLRHCEIGARPGMVPNTFSSRTRETVTGKLLYIQG